LEKPRTLEQLNSLFNVWLEECYQNKLHSALAGSSPLTAFKADSTPLQFVEAEDLANAFLHCETRKVDKVGCISFMGKKYEVGLDLLGCAVDVVYDPAYLEAITVEYDGLKPRSVKVQAIGEQAGKRPVLPPTLQKQPASASRLLAAAKTKNQERRERAASVISYRQEKKDV